VVWALPNPTLNRTSLSEPLSCRKGAARCCCVGGEPKPSWERREAAAVVGRKRAPGGENARRPGDAGQGSGDFGAENRKCTAPSAAADGAGGKTCWKWCWPRACCTSSRKSCCASRLVGLGCCWALKLSVKCWPVDDVSCAECAKSGDAAPLLSDADPLPLVLKGVRPSDDSGAGEVQLSCASVTRLPTHGQKVHLVDAGRLGEALDAAGGAELLGAGQRRAEQRRQVGRAGALQQPRLHQPLLHVDALGRRLARLLGHPFASYEQR